MRRRRQHGEEIRFSTLLLALLPPLLVHAISWRPVGFRRFEHACLGGTNVWGATKERERATTDLIVEVLVSKLAN